MNGNRFRTPALLTALTLALLGLAAPAQAGPARCTTPWGSQPQVRDTAPYTGAYVQDVRSGRHDCFDRLVVDIGGAGAFDSYSVRYVDRVVGSSGIPTPVRGGADIEVVVGASALSGDDVAYLPADRAEVVDVSGYRTFRQVAWVESFEGSTVLALGTRARLPVRAFVLAPPVGSGQDPRLVVDVAHRW
ncbi:hypothetical protein GB931_16410 [Modestobacter sp. I12A-02628]|uniref:AMIN-like domain-containing protein n=1 Tax=Goekera deserti TaxID=2497753 RepID=A0A7K3WJ73_9ACTN|nr:hypothetical protein [Goekera deserti]MPQ99470.1 hypothetical protein [Goekera deserti]NDI48957.1 hypothetical protein [Goekera deserti]NEL55573.1 hypothetical protein [Goekera deserti]